MSKYLVIIEEGIECFGAYVPDLPNCDVAVAKTIQEVAKIMQNKISTHLIHLEQNGETLPISSRAENGIRKTKEELDKLFLAENPNWKFKSRPFHANYLIPAEEENKEIQKLVQTIEEDRFGLK